MRRVGRAEAPEPIEKLWDELEAAGFWLAEEEYDEAAFGDAIAVLVRQPVAVRIVRDRGDWFLDLAGPGGGEWFSPMVWRTYLHGDVFGVETPSIGQQCAFVLSEWREIATAINATTDLLEELKKARSSRASARQAALKDNFDATSELG